MAFIAGLLCFLYNADIVNIGLFVFVASITGFIFTRFGFFLIPGFPTLGTIYSYVSGYGIILIFLVIVGYVFTGWQGVVSFFAGKLIASIVALVLDGFLTKTLFKNTRIPLTASEINFFNAYRLHASSLEISTNIDITEEEEKRGNWEKALALLLIVLFSFGLFGCGTRTNFDNTKFS